MNSENNVLPNNNVVLTIHDFENLERHSQIANELSHVELEKKQLENEQIKKQIDRSWTSCCLTVDKNMVQYFTQTAVLTGIIIFSCFQLSTGSEPSALYVSLLSTSIGLIIPTGTTRQSTSK